MSQSRTPDDSSVSSRAQSHTNASQLPQHTHSALSPDSLRSCAPPRQSPKSAALSAIATLPASTRSPASASSFLSQPNMSSTSPSRAKMNDISPIPSSWTKSQPSLPKETSETKGRTDNDSLGRNSGLPASHTSRRSASGSLDRIASLPISNAIIKQEYGLTPEPDAQGDIVPRSSSSATALQAQSSIRYPQSLPSSQPQRTALMAGSQSARIMPTCDGITSLLPTQRSSQSNSRPQNPQPSHPRPSQCSTPRSQQPSSTPGLKASHTVPFSQLELSNTFAKPPQRSQPQAHPSVVSQPKPSEQAAPSDRFGTRPQSRQLSHVAVTPSVPQTPTGPKVRASLSSQGLATSSRGSPSGNQPQVPSLAQTHTQATPTKTQRAPLSNTPNSPPVIGLANKQTRSPATAQSSSATQPTVQVQSQARTIFSSSVPTQPERPSPRGSLSHDAQVLKRALPATNGNGSSVPPGPDAVQDSFTSGSSMSSADDLDPMQGLRGSFLTSSEPVDHELLTKADGNFKPVPVVSCLEISNEELEELIVDLVETQGEPLVISDLHKTAAWDSDLFTPQKYEQLRPSQEPDGETIWVRSLNDSIDRPVSLPDFLARSDKEKTYSPDQRDKLYGKDLPCPPEWSERLAKIVHPRLVYHGDEDMSASLTEKARSVTQMCYFGPGHTCTPWHRDLCSSLGQNLMVWCDPGASSLWMITHPADADAVDGYIASKGGDPQSEGFAPHPNELLNVNFSIFCHKQSLGDLVLIPSRASHMVVNTDGRTMKAAWSRLTVETLASALFTDLPLYQRFCRQESYHIKPVIEETLIKFTLQIESNLEKHLATTPKMIRDLRGLLQLYDAILTDEYLPEWRNIEVVGGHDSYVECDFCGANVLHGYFECPSGETICTLCYCQGRLCGCPNAIEALKPRQHWRNFGERLRIRNDAAQTLLKVRPALASSNEPTRVSEAEDTEEEPPLRPVEILAEDEFGKKTWPLSFMAAFKLYNIRNSTGWRENRAPCRICKATLDLSQRYYCKPCRHSYCYGCLLHKLYIHPVHALAQKEPDLFHRYHRKASTLDYKEWKQDPLEFCDEARAHFALIEAARTNMNCVPVNKKCRIGFLDLTREYPHGLSGMLCVERSKKAAVDKVKATEARSSPSSTPVSRKRQADLIQSSSTSSPRMRSEKRAKVNLSSNGEPMDEDNLFAQIQLAKDVVAVPVIAPAPVSSPRHTTQARLSENANMHPEIEEVSTSAPTVANGIRKFVLRAGKAHPVSPASTTLSSPVSSPASVALIAPKPASEQNLLESTLATAPTQSIPASVVHKAVATIPVPSSAASALEQPNTATVAEPRKATNVPAQTTQAILVTPSTATTAAAQITKATIAAPTQHTMVTVSAPTPSITRTASAPVARRSAISPHGSGSPPTAPTAVAQAIEQGKPVANSLQLAASAVASGIGTHTSPAASATTSSEPTAGGLGSLDSMNLRVITEILRIFSQSNQKMITGQLDEIKKALARQQEEHDKAKAKEATENKEALVKLEATLLRRIEQLSSEMKGMMHKHELEMNEMTKKHKSAIEQLRKEVDLTAQQVESSTERVKDVEVVLGGLMEDITRRAQLELEAELLREHSQPPAVSGPASSSAYFAPTSNTR